MPGEASCTTPPPSSPQGSATVGEVAANPSPPKSREVILISAPSSLSAEGKVALLAVAVTGRWGWGLRHTTRRTTSTYFPLIKKEARAANQPATSPDLLRLPWLLLSRSLEAWAGCAVARCRFAPLAWWGDGMMSNRGERREKRRGMT